MSSFTLIGTFIFSFYIIIGLIVIGLVVLFFIQALRYMKEKRAREQQMITLLEQITQTIKER